MTIPFRFLSVILAILLASCSGNDSGYFSSPVTTDNDRSRLTESTFTDELHSDTRDRHEEEPDISDFQESSGGVLAPQMITGSYLVVCHGSDSQEHVIFCEVQNQSEFSEASSPDPESVRWMITDEHGKELSSGEFTLAAVSSGNPWKVRIEFHTEKTWIINLAGKGTSADVSVSTIDVSPYKKKPTEDQQEEASPEQESPATGETPPGGESIPENRTVLFSESFQEDPFTTEVNISWDLWGNLNFLDFSGQTFKCEIPSNSSNTYSGISSRNVYDFRDGFLQVTLHEAIAPLEGMEPALFGINAGNGNDVFIFVEAGKIYAQKTTSGIRNNLTSIPYDDFEHKFLAFRHNSFLSEMEFLVSSDGENWQLLAKTFIPFQVSNSRFEIQCGTWQVTPQATSATFDDLVFSKTE